MRELEQWQEPGVVSYAEPMNSRSVTIGGIPVYDFPCLVTMSRHDLDLWKMRQLESIVPARVWQPDEHNYTEEFLTPVTKLVGFRLPDGRLVRLFPDEEHEHPDICLV